VLNNNIYNVFNKVSTYNKVFKILLTRPTTSHYDVDSSESKRDQSSKLLDFDIVCSA